MAKVRDASGGGPAYQRLSEGKQLHRSHDRSHDHSFSDTGKSSRKPRGVQKRADIQASTKDRRDALQTAGTVWACCVGTEIIFVDLLQNVRSYDSSSCSITIDSTYSEVLFCHCFSTSRICFIFRFGCVVAWDMDFVERQQLVQWLEQFVKEPLGRKKEDDDMSYVWAERATIKADHIHLVTINIFEKLAYSYAFAQSVKLAVFETVVDDTIEKTRTIPEGLAQTGKINSTREDIGRRMGELFVNRFYINLHTDILDTPDIFWDNDDFADHYDKCRRYLEIPKRVEILNQRLDIIKDLYEMLNNELTIQHGYKLEWIVIYLICLEVLIEVLWNIIVKDLLHWV